MTWTGISALMARAMQVDARKLWAHLFRLAFVGLIYFSLLSAQLQSLSFGAPGKYFLQNIVMLNAIFITLAGISFFSSVITEEKEEKTLGLLQMAGIGPMSVLLGKSTSRLIQAFMLLLVQFPFTLLSITLGGVTMQQVVAAYLSLFAYLMGLANVALFWSVICRRTGNAAGMTSLTLFCYFTGSPLAEGLSQGALSYGWGQGAWYQRATVWCLGIVQDWGVFQRLYAIMETGFAAATTASLEPTWSERFEFYGKLLFSTQVVTNSLCGLACFILARLVYEPFTRDVDQVGDSRGLVLASSSRIRMFSSGRCWTNPFVWKDFHFLTGGYSLAIIKWFAYAGILGAIIAVNWYFSSPYQTNIDWRDIIPVYIFIVIACLILEASLSAARLFHDEIRLQTMSALLMLPRSIPYLAYSKAAGCLLGLLPGLFWLTIGVAGLIASNSFQTRNVYGHESSLLLDLVFSPDLWGGILILSFFLHLTALLSLFVKWGALPLSIGIMLLMTCACPILPIMFGVIQQVKYVGAGHIAATGVLMLINIVGSFVMQMMIGARLQEIGSR